MDQSSSYPLSGPYFWSVSQDTFARLSQYAPIGRVALCCLADFQYHRKSGSLRREHIVDGPLVFLGILKVGRQARSSPFR